jgi:hypothetical protein
MIGQRGNSVESLRQHIAVPARTEAVLWACAAFHPEEASWIESSLNSRCAVLREFERLVNVAQGATLFQQESAQGERSRAA